MLAFGAVGYVHWIVLQTYLFVHKENTIVLSLYMNNKNVPARVRILYERVQS